MMLDTAEEELVGFGYVSLNEMNSKALKRQHSLSDIDTSDIK
jgi:hypothetical protein